MQLNKLTHMGPPGLSSIAGLNGRAHSQILSWQLGSREHMFGFRSRFRRHGHSPHGPQFLPILPQSSSHRAAKCRFSPRSQLASPLQQMDLPDDNVAQPSRLDRLC